MKLTIQQWNILHMLVQRTITAVSKSDTGDYVETENLRTIRDYIKSEMTKNVTSHAVFNNLTGDQISKTFKTKRSAEKYRKTHHFPKVEHKDTIVKSWIED